MTINLDAKSALIQPRTSPLKGLDTTVPGCTRLHPRAEPDVEKSYHQRVSLEHTLFGPFPRLVLVCINADFCDQGRIFPHFSSSTLFSFAPFQISVIFQAFAPFFAKFAEFFVDFQRRQQILQIFVKFQQIFPEFCRISTFCKK